MPDWASRLAGTLLVSALLVAPLATHLALVMHRGMALAGVLMAVQAMLVTWIASSSISQYARRGGTRYALRAGVCVVAFLLTLLLWRFVGEGPLVVSAVPHAMAYLALLTVFAASLLPGREAVVTVFARIARGPLPPEVMRYTRRVTWAWCWFSAAQLTASLLLLLFAPFRVWSVFVNLCNLPLIGLLIGAEYSYRQWRYAAQPPERLSDMFRIVRQIRTQIPVHIPATPSDEGRSVRTYIGRQ